MARPVTITKVLTAADADGICASQTPGAAGNLTINGALATAGVATMDTQRQVLFTFAADESARTFGVYGTLQNGTEFAENVTGTATTATTLADYKTITRISVDAATAGALTVGTNGVGSSPWYVPNRHISPCAISLELDFDGTANADVEHCFNRVPLERLIAPDATKIPVVYNHSTLAAKTTDSEGTYTSPPAGIRLTINSGTAAVRLTVIQAGISGGS